MSRIDLHAHPIPPEYTAELRRRSLLPFPPSPWSEDLTYETTARYEIDAMVLSLSPPGVSFGDGGLAREFARVVNERAAALKRSDPDRFKATIRKIAPNAQPGPRRLVENADLHPAAADSCPRPSTSARRLASITTQRDPRHRLPSVGLTRTRGVVAVLAESSLIDL